MNQPPEIALFFGHFHPLLVHLPIGMILLLAILEVIAWIPKFQRANVSAGFILAIAAPLAVVTALCGWLLSLGGGYDEKLLSWHQWLGITTAIGCVITAIFYWRRKRLAYHASLFTTAAVMGVAGHLGGSLTHGSDYLTEHAPAFLKKLTGGKKNVAATATPGSVYAQFIAPVFEKNCVSCHGPQKSKGGLRLDSYAGLLKGGEHGAVIKPGDTEKSVLLQLVNLPADNDDHMPPDGKPQPSAHEIALLKWWIESGASDSKTAAELHLPAEFLEAAPAEK